MSTINDILRRYNDGILRGAKKKLADSIGVEEGTVSRWISGKLTIGESKARAVAKELGVSEDQLRTAISAGSSRPGEVAELRREVGRLSFTIDRLVKFLELKFKLEEGTFRQSKGHPVLK